jgi:hypothetical protein
MKRLLKALWRATLPARRPLANKVEAFLAGCVARALESQKEEVSLVLDTVVAEQFRLQAQVEELQRLLLEERAGREHASTA